MGLFATKNSDGASAPTTTRGTISDDTADRLDETAGDHNPAWKLDESTRYGRGKTGQN